MKGPITSRIAALWSRPAVRIAWALTALAGLALPILPLARTPGYESALLATCAMALLAGGLGIAAARRERQREPDLPALTTVLHATLAAFALAAAAILPFLASAALAGLSGPGCSITAGLGWYPILPLPTAFLGAAIGVACGALVEGRRGAVLLYFAILSLSLILSAWPVATGPQVFFYHHLLGYLPGPIYDERVPIEAPLRTFRLLTLAWGLGCVGLVALCWDRGRLRLPRFRPLAALLAAGSLGWVGAGVARGSEDGWRQSNASVEERLGGRAEGARCTVIHPRELETSRLQGFLDECDHRVEELESFFGVEARRPVVFLYRSREEKRRLTGAARTQFAKPWLDQIHVDLRDAPHPVLKHELAHLVAAPLGRPPFGISAAVLGLLPLQGVIEGAAVAADWPAGELSIHEEAKAMRALGLAPRLDRIVSAAGFWAESSSRAYSYAGSFFRWLIEERGREAFGRLYRDGDFRAAYGAELDELLGAWEAFLDELPLPDHGLSVAERRFRRPPIFRRPCAREVADLAARARAALGAGTPLRAAEIYSECAALEPGDPFYLRAQAQAFAEAAAPDRILPLLQAVSERDPGTRASIQAHLADAYASAGRLEEARLAYEAAAALLQDEASARSIAVKLEAIGDPELARVTLPFLAKGTDAKLFAIRDLLEERPGYGTGWYLLGRRLSQRGEHEQALRAFERALEGDALLPALAPEARRLQALSLQALGRHEEACPILEALTQERSPHQAAVAADLLGLCRYQLRRAGG